MELKDILVVALASIIILVVVHISVFWVVRTLYPPTPTPMPTPTFIQPTVVQQPEPQQNVTIPTYETPIPVEAPREEEQRRGPPPPEATSIHGNSRVDSAVTQPRE